MKQREANYPPVASREAKAPQVSFRAAVCQQGAKARCTLLFLKAPRSTGQSRKILGAHADRTQRRQVCPSNLGMRQAAALTPLHTTHAHYSTRGNTVPGATLPMGVERGPAASRTWRVANRATARSRSSQVSCGKKLNRENTSPRLCLVGEKIWLLIL